MHSIWIKNLQVGDADKQLCAAQALVAANLSRLEELKSHESIKYIEGIKKTDGSQTGQSSVPLELSTPQEANEIIREHLEWDGEIHTCQRLYLNCIVKQCFNC